MDLLGVGQLFLGQRVDLLGLGQLLFHGGFLPDEGVPRGLAHPILPRQPLRFAVQLGDFLVKLAVLGIGLLNELLITADFRDQEVFLVGVLSLALGDGTADAGADQTTGRGTDQGAPAPVVADGGAEQPAHERPEHRALSDGRLLVVRGAVGVGGAPRQGRADRDGDEPFRA